VHFLMSCAKILSLAESKGMLVYEFDICMQVQSSRPCLGENKQLSIRA
jgi:hypothetical protein